MAELAVQMRVPGQEVRVCAPLVSATAAGCDPLVATGVMLEGVQR